jgi:nicotinamide mononucleotide transporter
MMQLVHLEYSSDVCLEVLGVLFGLVSVYAAAKERIVTWPAGLLSVFFLGLLFFRTRLYADMFLQVYFFATSLFGWYRWSQPAKEVKISRLGGKQIWFTLGFMVVGHALCTRLVMNLHTLFPKAFTEPADYPVADSLILVLSVVANFLLAIKKVESWVLWVVVNAISIGVFFSKGLMLLAIEYAVFLIIAIFGLANWNRSVSR